MADTKKEFKKGLEGVYFDETTISKAMPEEAKLIYRGYPVAPLAQTCRFEEVAYLLRFGELPTSKELEEFSKKERAARRIDDEVITILRATKDDCHPMDSLRTAVSFLGTRTLHYGEEYHAKNEEYATALLAQVATIVAADLRIKSNKEPIAPDESLPFSENFFQMCFGEIPDEKVVKAFDGSLTLYAEHGFNASTFTSRVVVSTLSDMYSGVTAAIGSLKGPLHGGANEAVMEILQEISEPENAKAWLTSALAEKRKIMGFGHRLYKNGDSRVPQMKLYRDQVAEMTENSKWVEISNVLEKTMIAEKGIYPNLDFPAGPTYYMMGFPIPFFTPIFALARIAGWTTHIMEQLSDNRLVRPRSLYVGPEPREVIPMAERG